jgi:hypothetical protein
VLPAVCVMSPAQIARMLRAPAAPTCSVERGRYGCGKTRGGAGTPRSPHIVCEGQGMVLANMQHSAARHDTTRHMRSAQRHWPSPLVCSKSVISAL